MSHFKNNKSNSGNPNTKYGRVAKKKTRKRIKSSVVNAVTTTAVVICVLILIITGVLNSLTKDAVEPNKAKLEGKYGHMEIAKISEIPKHLQNAVIAIEDKRFYSHNGVDVFGLIRSALKNTLTGSTQGGSTLEMQISKNLLTSSEQTIKRKLMDIKIAHKMNKVMSKSDILEVYLNSMYLGRGATGVKSGARIYFGKDISELNLAESAMLAGITKHPSKYAVYSIEPISTKDKKDDLKNKLIFSKLKEGEKAISEKAIEKLKSFNLIDNNQYKQLKDGEINVQKAVLNKESIERQKIVLFKMKEEGLISKKEYDNALNTSIIINTSLR